MYRRLSGPGVLLAGALLAGCAAVPQDRGAAAVTDLVRSRSSLAGDLRLSATDEASAARVAELLAHAPLSADDTVRLALLQSPRARQLYAELGFAQADLLDASRLPNPVLGFARLDAQGEAHGARTTWSLSQSFTELLFLRTRLRLARSERLQAEQHVALALLTLESEVRRAYWSCVGAERIAGLRTQAATAARLGAELARRYREAGNLSELQWSQEAAYGSEAALTAERATAAAVAARATLATLVGLPTDDARFVIGTELPVPAALAADPATLAERAKTQRLDLIALRARVAEREQRWTHTRRWRAVQGLDLGVERETETDGQRLQGPTAQLALPVFSAGGAAVLRARVGMEADRAELQMLELRVGNETRARQAAVLAADRIVAEVRDRLLPLRERGVVLQQQRQAWMLIGPFELLASKARELDTRQQYLEAVRDAWLARVDLEQSLGGVLNPQHQQGVSP